MSKHANDLWRAWKAADPKLRADTIEYLRGLREAVPILAADLLTELAFASQASPEPAQDVEP